MFAFLCFDFAAELFFHGVASSSGVIEEGGGKSFSLSADLLRNQADWKCFFPTVTSFHLRLRNVWGLYIVLLPPCLFLTFLEFK